MRLVLISGAGLSATAGVPTFKEAANHPLYKAFSSSGNIDIARVTEQIREHLSQYKPSSAHRECVLLEDVCKCINIDFIHYTLNIDVLLEKTGGFPVHLYGCENDHQSMVDFRFFPKIDITNFEWHCDDFVLFLGISETGLPVAYIESCILEVGGHVSHYNLVTHNGLSGRHIIGDLLNTFSCTDVLSRLPLKIDLFPDCDGLGNDVHFVEFPISEREYTIYFTPKPLVTISPKVLDQIAEETGQKIDDNTYEVKFDLKSNLDNETYFQRPTTNLSYRQMQILGEVLIAYIIAHYESIPEVPSLYVAEAQYHKLNAFYNRLAKITNFKIKCLHSTIKRSQHNSKSGDFHAFKPTW